MKVWNAIADLDDGKYAGDATSWISQHPVILISQRAVILSGVVVRKANDNAVEGPRVRSQYQHRFREFPLC
ncbi:MAG TPA: hypothetical protein VN950_25285 [Terriglobales bacterium]|nr:hypothetical protein [Terriglobales bacterium]